MSFSSIVGNIVNVLVVIPHIVVLLFHNLIVLFFVAGFFYGIFRLCQIGWRKLRGRGAQQEPLRSVQKDESESGGG
jgi:hypothetical protein